MIQYQPNILVIFYINRLRRNLEKKHNLLVMLKSNSVSYILTKSTFNP